MELQKLIARRKGLRKLVSILLVRLEDLSSSEDAKHTLKKLSKYAEDITDLNEKIVNHDDTADLETELVESEEYSNELDLQIQRMKHKINLLADTSTDTLHENETQTSSTATGSESGSSPSNVSVALPGFIPHSIEVQPQNQADSGPQELSIKTEIFEEEKPTGPDTVIYRRVTPKTVSSAKQGFIPLPIGGPPQNEADLGPQELWVKTETPEREVYFYNPKTRESVWTKPDSVKIITHSEEDEMLAQSQQTVSTTIGPTSVAPAAQAQGSNEDPPRCPTLQMPMPVQDRVKQIQHLLSSSRPGSRTASHTFKSRPISAHLYTDSDEDPPCRPRQQKTTSVQDRANKIQQLLTSTSLTERTAGQSTVRQQRPFSYLLSTGTVESVSSPGLNLDLPSTKITENTITHKLMVAAIDIGSTYSGWAFSFYNEYEREPTQVYCKNWNSGCHISMKAPTTVLIKSDGKTFEAFGYEAEDRYAELVQNKKHKPYYYFQRFKMMLYDNKTLNRKDELEDTHGKKLPAKTVFSLVIGFLRNDVLAAARLKISGVITDKEIQWVLTVPAIWNFRAKQFMRECAIEAGIQSKDLLLALEPEAASLYCKHLEIHRKNEGESDGKTLDAFKPGAQYMIVDAGGGTIDIIIHKVNDDGSLEEVSASSGGNWGGNNVDTALLDLVKEVQGEAYIQRLKNKFVDDYLYLLREIEVKKRNINPGVKSKLVLRVPVISKEMFTAQENDDISKRIKRNTKLKGHVTTKADKILFDHDLVAGIFSKTTEEVVGHLKTILSKITFRETDVILMVGGFSESPMLFNAVDMAFKNNKVMKPTDAGLSVLKGAVIYGHSKTYVKVRVSPYTYGFMLKVPHDPNRYDDSHLFTLENGTAWVHSAFIRLIEINERIPIDEETPRKGAEPSEKCTGFSFQLFASKDPDPIYTDDSSCFQVGEVQVDCRDNYGNVGAAEVSLKFGGTEVEARATLLSNGKLTSTVFNFLD